MKGVLVKADFLELIVSGVEDCSAGGLVNAARLHTYKAVFYDVGDTNAVASADFVELFNQLYRAYSLAVELNGNTLFKAQCYVLGLIGSLLG